MRFHTVALLALMPVGSAQPGGVIHGTIHREGDERFRLTIGATGEAVVEVSGGPADCAFQVGSQGFQESDTSPVDWTDGQPGQAVRHKFRAQAGRPGTIWVQLRTRMSGVSGAGWSAVACSGGGPYYVTPERGRPAGAAPATFEGRPVQPPVAFRLMTVSGASRPGSLRDERLGFAMDYPEEFLAAPAETGSFQLTGRAGTPAGEAVVTVMVAAKAAIPNSSEMQQVLRIHERLSGGGAELVKLGPMTAAGQTAAFASHVYDGKNSQGKTVPFDHVQLVLDHGANYYLISFAAPHDVFVKQTAAFKQMLRSWRFLP